MPFETVAFSADCPSLHLNFVDLICVFTCEQSVKVSLRLSYGCEMKKTAGIACHAALLCGVHHRACSSLGLNSGYFCSYH